MRKRARIIIIILTALLGMGLIIIPAAVADKRPVAADQIRSLTLTKSIPSQLNYQGYLVDAADTSAVTATLEMTFRLYDAEMGGSEQWSETHPAVDVDNGLFQVLLGSVTSFPAGLFDGSTLWLQTEVGPEAMVPRKPLVSVAYSHRSNSAEMLDDNTLLDLDARWVNEGQANSVTSSMIIGGAGSGLDADMVDGQHAADFISMDDLDHLNADDGNPVNAVYVDVDGKVGIGTSTPAHTLDVNGAVNATTYWGDGSHLTSISGTTDNDWTISGSDVYHQTGNVGIGTNAPTAPLTIQTIVGPEILFASTGTNADIIAPVALKIGTDSAFPFHILTNNMYRINVTAAGQVGIGTLTPARLLDVAGNMQADTLFLGRSAKAGQDGGLLLYNDGAADPVIELGDHGNQGGKINLFNMSGNWTNRLEPDVDGSGGFLEVERNDGSWGFFVDGNSGGTEEPWVEIHGSSRSVDFVMDNSGDASVVFPADAISAGEIMDEPGVSNSLGPDFFYLNGGHIGYAIDSVSINIPAAGYVEVTAGCYLNLWHANGAQTEIEVAIDKAPRNASYDFPGAQVASVPASMSTDVWQFPCTSTRLYEESTAGVHKYYLNADFTSGDDPSANIARSYIRAVYYPTLYGTLTIAETEGLGSVATGSRTPSDGSQKALEPARRSITVEDHNARLEAEMAALRAELEALKEQVQNQKR